MTGRGVRHRRAAVSPPILEPVPESLELILADQIYIARENLPPGASKSFASPGRVSKPRILSGAVNAPSDLRKTENHPLRGGAPTAFRPAAWLS